MSKLIPLNNPTTGFYIKEISGDMICYKEFKTINERDEYIQTESLLDDEYEYTTNWEYAEHLRTYALTLDGTNRRSILREASRIYASGFRELNYDNIRILRNQGFLNIELVTNYGAFEVYICNVLCCQFTTMSEYIDFIKTIEEL